MSKAGWVQVQDNLKAAVGANNFTNWIAPLELDTLADGVATFCVPTNFIGNYVSTNFGDLILYHLNRIGLQVQRLGFIAAAARPSLRAASRAPAQAMPRRVGPAATRVAQAIPAPVEAAPATPAPYAAAPSATAVPGTQLDARYTFDRFVVGKSNELAYAAARRVAQGGPVGFNPLFMYGGVGLGKTHLMHAIAHELRSQRPDLNVMYLSAEQFMYRFVSALRDKKALDFKAMLRSVDVLMIDDVQFIAGKDSTQEEFFHTFNALVDAQKQVIISCDRAPGEIRDIDDRIRSRLQAGLVVDLHPSDFSLRLGVLETRAKAAAESYQHVTIDDDVLPFLAHRISSNIRVLEGALTRLYAFAGLVNRPISIALTQDCLADILRASDRRVTVEDIQRRVCEHYNIRIADMVGPKRLRAFARPRQVAMYLSKKLTTRSLPEIGRHFGGRDHTTIMHGVKKIESLMASDSQMADDLQALRRALEA
ncbi:chromosomal replication initiation protein [Ketogulonicigenium robustum]|uniref:Chromosomal replication initiator protein DnaA n=1 Tax=Ketogulonicigenium robustum TaxID=92947 RepID=A0A1W6P1R8_9RHOB|nr:chromosomal replication initiator protein DnaA [Ketogulonicigenium robustum]ARO15389.1 chromosomal replication initiation protein [Ketogulonicigenium robustum]